MSRILEISLLLITLQTQLKSFFRTAGFNQNQSIPTKQIKGLQLCHTETMVSSFLSSIC